MMATGSSPEGVVGLGSFPFEGSFELVPCDVGALDGGEAEVLAKVGHKEMAKVPLGVGYGIGGEEGSAIGSLMGWEHDG